MPLMIAGASAIGAGTSLLGGLFGASASQQAAQEQEQAEQKGINLLQNDQSQGEANYSPYLSAGSAATKSLASLLGTPGAGLLTPWTQTFTAPTAAQAAQTPGYQFQLQQGLSAAQNAAAGQGGLLSGRTLADLNNYAQGTASTNYQNTYNNALTQYQSAYNTFLNNQNNQYSRLMGVSGEGLNAAQGAGSLLSNLGGDTASLLGAQGAAAAAGTVGSANAISGALSGAGNSLMGGLTLSALNGNGSQSAGFNPNIWTGSGSMPSLANPYAATTPTAPYSINNLPVNTSASSIPGFALGTDFAPGGPAMVGEAGPEMVNLPRGSQVIPNAGFGADAIRRVPNAPFPGAGSPIAGGPPISTPVQFGGPTSPLRQPMGNPPMSAPMPFGGPARPVAGSPVNGFPDAFGMPSNFSPWGMPRMMPLRALA